MVASAEVVEILLMASNSRPQVRMHELNYVNALKKSLINIYMSFFRTLMVL